MGLEARTLAERTAMTDAFWLSVGDRGTLMVSMQKPIVVRGHLGGPRRIDLDEPVNEVTGEVEVTLRVIEPAPADSSQDVFEFLRSLPPGTRSKEDIDRQIAEERDSWGDR